MRQRQEILYSILTTQFGTGMSFPSSITHDDLIKAGLMNEVIRTWKRLGGISEQIPLSFGKWDICLDSFIIELDEEQHFNRYRTITLNSFIYHIEKGFNVFEYIKYCSDFEINCLKKSSWGKYWTSCSTEKQFGLPGINGDLENSGSPRWRQRAFYDYLRDVFAHVYRVRLIRISVYDQLIVNGKMRLINDILEENSPLSYLGIAKFIEKKINNNL